MTHEELRATRTRLGFVTQKSLALATGYSHSAIASMESNRRRVSPRVVAYLQQLDDPEQRGEGSAE